jgi:hypothetical protein
MAKHDSVARTVICSTARTDEAIVHPEVLASPISSSRLIGQLFGQSWTPRESFSTESVQFRTAIEEKSYAFAGLYFRNHTLARHRPSRGPAAKITRALHKAIRITPPPNSWTLYRHR